MIATGASPLSHRSTNLSGLKSPADDAFRAKSGELKLHGNQNGSFAPDASLHPIETGELVLRASLQTLFEVNTAGAFIWCCLDDGLTLDELGARSRTIRATSGDARKFVKPASEIGGISS